MALAEMLAVKCRCRGVGKVKVLLWSREPDRVGESMKLSSSPGDGLAGNVQGWREGGGGADIKSNSIHHTIHTHM